MKIVAIILALTFSASVQAGHKNHDAPDTYCPLPESKVMPNFDMKKFTGTWYVQKAQDSMMTPATQMFCIRQTWSILDSDMNCKLQNTN